MGEQPDLLGVGHEVAPEMAKLVSEQDAAISVTLWSDVATLQGSARQQQVPALPPAHRLGSQQCALEPVSLQCLALRDLRLVRQHGEQCRALCSGEAVGEEYAVP